MYPFVHFILSIVPSLLIMMVYGWVGIFFWLGAFFVDVDHYFWYIIRVKDLSLKKAYVYGKDINHKESFLHIFHTVEFWILISILAVYSKTVLIVITGLAYHTLIDFVDIINRRLFFARNLSYFMWLKDHSPSNAIKLNRIIR